MISDKKVKIKRKNEVVVVISDMDVYNNNVLFKSHRDYIAHRFKQLGFEVIRWTHTYNEDGTHKEEGLIYRTTDSEINPTIEVVGVIGQSLKPIGPVANVNLEGT